MRQGEKPEANKTIVENSFRLPHGKADKLIAAWGLPQVS